MKRKLWALLLAGVLLLTGCAGIQVPDTTAATERLVEPGNAVGLRVHYIDVGQADCALLECDGEFMIIDGGNVADSSLVVSYLQSQGVQALEAVVCTHAHEDHVGGLPGVLAVFPAAAVYAPTRTYSSNCFDDFVYYTDQQGLEITVPKPGDQFSLGAATVTVLGPVTAYSETNNTSIVLLVQYGENRFLFTGDMETKAETDLLDYWDGKLDICADVLKVGHHGSSTSSGYRFLRQVDPFYAVISVGEGNQYGHPNEEPLSRLSDADVAVYRTDKLGSIIATADGSSIRFSWSTSSAVPDVPEQTKQTHAQGGITETQAATETQGQYVGNVNSKVLHSIGCSSLPSEKNRVYFDTYEEALSAGYHDCSKCKPGS